ncbi:MAG: DUF1700 domain-containing protein [Eubacteriales bacterium]|nr:DUF1700 domain-containing protein [Eubacteriales bacterium]
MESRVKMNREIYMRSLRERLRKLPKEDQDMAMEYFREYFDEAGPENEAQAIENLGSPKEAAEQIIMDMAVKNCEEAPKAGMKRSFRSVWIGILAVFAAPIAIPLALAAVAVLGGVGLAVVAVLASLVVAGVAVVAGAAVTIVLGGIMILKSPANAIATIGAGFLCMGVGVLICPFAVNLTKGCMQMLTKIFGKMVRRFTRKSASVQE